MNAIYLDYAATTPVDPRVALKMSRYLTQEGDFGNPSSDHTFGKAAKNAVETARAHVADLVGAEPSEIIFTSGATESNNLALKGALQLYKQKGRHIITLKTEHSSVLDCCEYLEKNGFEVTYLTPETSGILDLEKLQEEIRPDTQLISVMHVNNETGVIQDIKSIANLAKSHGVLLHVDAAQSVGKIAIHLQDIPVDLMSFSSHKIYGPKGIGALYLRRKPRVKVAPQMHGGGHEQGMRSGTLATHQIVGMGEAFHLAKIEMQKDYENISVLRKLLLEKLKDIQVNGDVHLSVPHIVNIRFDHVTADDLMQALPNIAISAGSACHAKGIEPSFVLRAMGLSVEAAKRSVRFSFGRFTTEQEILFAAKLINHSIPRLDISS